jgi:hypothetical protein
LDLDRREAGTQIKSKLQRWWLNCCCPANTATRRLLGCCFSARRSLLGRLTLETLLTWGQGGRTPCASSGPGRATTHHRVLIVTMQTTLNPLAMDLTLFRQSDLLNSSYCRHHRSAAPLLSHCTTRTPYAPLPGCALLLSSSLHCPPLSVVVAKGLRGSASM